MKPEDIQGTMRESMLCDCILAALMSELRTEVIDRYIGLHQEMTYCDLCKYFFHSEKLIKRREK